MNPEHFRRLYEFDSWANQRTLESCSALTAEQFTRDLGSSFRSVRDTLVHIMLGEWFWHERWQGRSPSSVPAPKPYPDLASLRADWKEIEADVLRFVHVRTEEDLLRVLRYRTTEGQPNSQPLWQMLQHVANHSTYHRGQVATMLRQLGAKPTATDLFLYYHEPSGKFDAAAIAPETLRLLYDYNAWANRRMLESCAPLTDEQFTRDLGSSFRSVRDTVAHILGAEWVWYERFHGRSPSALPAAMQFSDLAGVRARWAELERDLLPFVAGVSARDLAKIHHYRTLTRGDFANPLWQSLQHVVNHSTYHRGQVATMVRQLSGKPNCTDLIYFYRERSGQALD